MDNTKAAKAANPLVAANDNSPPRRHPGIEYDVDGNVIQIKRNKVPNPLGCIPHQYKRGAPPPVDSSETDAHKRAVEEWRATAPEDDEVILPVRPSRSSGGQHAELRKFVPVLRWWRDMLNPPSEAGAIPVAANDNEPDFIWSVPDRNPKPVEPEKWLGLWDGLDVEWEWVNINRPDFIGPLRRKRLSRAGKMWFNTVPNGEMRLKNPAVGATRKTYPVPLSAVWRWREHGRTVLMGQESARNREDETAANQAGVAQANELLSHLYDLPIRYFPKGPTKPGTSLTASQSRALIDEAIANTPQLPVVTKCPPGLPTGGRDVAGAFLCLQRQPKHKGGSGENEAEVQVANVRTPVDIGKTVMDMKADNDNFAEFRRLNPNEAAIIDLMCARGTRSMADLEAATGRSDPGTNSRKAVAALATVVDFLKESAA
ncbi:hypothetical protein OF122_11300 [Pelagibacterium flavum]|uniref:Uncharacterized protein n=1 Tax=Pelagibacterium flavum TaxID=2984530 RepID=A0ABY6IJ90_9HYPH|nr:hypothetical protein [Pelagibacterium sp. YIM 151497]UYQ70660.1 hypothetical protein OF122_11300 [Pelagibacterium sp. YIM 151497]